MIEWYAPGDIRFSREQMLWMIEHLLPLEGTDWPSNPKETGYTEAPRVQTSRSHRANFETPAQFYAEVTYRTSRTGHAGETLVWEVQHGLSDYELLSPQAKRALNYISGWRRRHQSFSRWCWEQSQKADKTSVKSSGKV